MRDFARHGALVFCGLMTASVCTYVFFGLVSRTVGVADSGLFFSLVSAILIAALPAGVAGGVLTKMSAQARGRDQINLINVLGTYASLSLLPVALLTTGVLLFGLAGLTNYFHTHDVVLLLLASTAFVLTFALTLQRAVLQGASAFGAFVASSVLEASVKALTGVVVWASHGGLQLALIGYVVAVAASYGFTSTRWRGADLRERPQVSRMVVVRQVVGIALPISALTAVSAADVVLVRHGLGGYASGLYSAVALIGRALFAVLQFLPTVLLPRVASLYVSGLSTGRVLAGAVATTATIVAVALIVAAMEPGAVIAVVSGRKFEAASPLVFPYVAAIGALSGTYALAAYLIGIDRMGFALPLVGVAGLEVGAIAIYHPDIATVVRLVLIGHSALLVCCAGDVLLSLRPSRRAHAVRRSV